VKVLQKLNVDLSSFFKQFYDKYTKPVYFRYIQLRKPGMFIQPYLTHMYITGNVIVIGTYVLPITGEHTYRKHFQLYTYVCRVGLNEHSRLP
jgi:hypothetical protein